MGIDVDGARVVRVNQQHEHRVVTDPARPVPRARLSGLPIVSIFRRQEVRHDNLDGNPLIYALKGKFNYAIPAADFRQLLVVGRTILPNALAGIQFDLVAPLPSSSAIALTLAKRASRQHDDCPILQCLDKATIGQVLAAAPLPDAVKPRDRIDYTSALGRLQQMDPAAMMEMKVLKLPLRRYFVPIVATAAAVQCDGQRVLLVDDIVGSGRSLVVARDALAAAGAQDVHALTLLSRLG